MIELSVEPYCHQCTEFEAETTKARSIALGVLTGEDVHTVVQCEHRDKCRALYENIEKSVLKKESERIKIETVYVVMVSCECDDSYYPDYDYIHCICSTKEKAEEVVNQLIEKNKNEDPCRFKDASVAEYVLNVIPY